MIPCSSRFLPDVAVSTGAFKRRRRRRRRRSGKNQFVDPSISRETLLPPSSFLLLILSSSASAALAPPLLLLLGRCARPRSRGDRGDPGGSTTTLIDHVRQVEQGHGALDSCPQQLRDI
ncbi:unnamed protein product [Pleuronectes platessa]|uniref:Uncharacterized protein n=1 Tax=Pleuronectes platessa TaxID=8262 RepID=A0A9N7U449_PLEPL|nr:unnamed protein product [Pleuronectes platessa]